jgi:hypothetical protein
MQLFSRHRNPGPIVTEHHLLDHPPCDGRFNQRGSTANRLCVEPSATPETEEWHAAHLQLHDD